jgi:hypothetical protein
MKDHLVADKTLSVENGLSRVQSGRLCDHHKSITRTDLPTKPNFFHPTEPNDSAWASQIMAVVAGNLGSDFTHHNAGHDGETGHVATNPELMICDVFIANHKMVFRVHVNNGCELFHLKSLKIAYPNRRLICDYSCEIQLIRIDERGGRHAASISKSQED